MHMKSAQKGINSGFFFEQNHKNSRQKKLKTAKTQGKFCPKTQGTGAFPNLQLKETQKNVVKNWKLALILKLKTTLNIENLDIFRGKTQHFCNNSVIFSKTQGFFTKLKDFGSKTQCTGALEPSQVPN